MIIVNGFNLILHLFRMGFFFRFVHKFSGAVFTYRLVVFIKSIVHDRMVIKTSKCSCVDYFRFHTLQIYTFLTTKYNTLYLGNAKFLLCYC